MFSKEQNSFFITSDFGKVLLDMINNLVKDELLRLGLEDLAKLSYEEFYQKDGIFLYRVKYLEDFYILKYFSNQNHSLEMKNYTILQNLKIPTLKVFGKTSNS